MRTKKRTLFKIAFGSPGGALYIQTHIYRINCGDIYLTCVIQSIGGEYEMDNSGLDMRRL